MSYCCLYIPSSFSRECRLSLVYAQKQTEFPIIIAWESRKDIGGANKVKWGKTWNSAKERVC